MHRRVDHSVEQTFPCARCEQHRTDRERRRCKGQRQQQQACKRKSYCEHIEDRERSVCGQAMRQESSERHADDSCRTQRRRTVQRRGREIEAELVMQEGRRPDDDAADRTVGEEEDEAQHQSRRSL